MTGENLNPRDEHVGRTFTAPHDELYRAMRGFLKDLQGAEEAYREEVIAIRKNLQVPAQYTETPDVERYSLAIQVFAAMTIEAAISFYAVLRFGGENHDEHFRWGSADNRLRTAFDHAGIDSGDDAEILRIVRDVMGARHQIVHPFSAEFLGTEQATIQAPHRPFPDVSAAAGRRAIENVDRFFELMRQLDEPHSRFFVQF
jgi:hypothetical protein